MHIVFLTDRFGKVVPIRRLNQLVKRLPLDAEDKVTLYFYEQILANMEDDEYFGRVLDTLDGADLIVACGLGSINQMMGDERRHFRMPDLTVGNFEKTYIQSQLNTLTVVIDTLRAKKITY